MSLQPSLLALSLLALEVEEQHECEGVPALKEALDGLQKSLNVSLLFLSRFIRPYMLLVLSVYIVCTLVMQYSSSPDPVTLGFTEIQVLCPVK